MSSPPVSPSSSSSSNRRPAPLPAPKPPHLRSSRSFQNLDASDPNYADSANSPVTSESRRTPYIPPPRVTSRTQIEEGGSPLQTPPSPPRQASFLQATFEAFLGATTPTLAAASPPAPAPASVQEATRPDFEDRDDGVHTSLAVPSTQGKSQEEELKFLTTIPPRGDSIEPEQSSPTPARASNEEVLDLDSEDETQHLPSQPPTEPNSYIPTQDSEPAHTREPEATNAYPESSYQEAPPVQQPVYQPPPVSPAVQKLLDKRADLQRNKHELKEQMERLERQLNSTFQHAGLQEINFSKMKNETVLNALLREREGQFDTMIREVSSQNKQLEAERKRLLVDVGAKEASVREIESQIAEVEAKLGEKDNELRKALAKLEIRNKSIRNLQGRLTKEMTDRVFHERNAELHQASLEKQQPGHEKFRAVHEEAQEEAQALNAKLAELKAGAEGNEKLVEQLTQQRGELDARREALVAKRKRFVTVMDPLMQGTFAVIGQLLQQCIKEKAALDELKEIDEMGYLD
ncbi:hypothetical protein BJ742DRAFT_792441, partial [Cladochytrium replicatum]